MKRSIALALAACLLLTFTISGCGGGNTTPATNPPATDPPASAVPDSTDPPAGQSEPAEPTDPPATPEPTEEPVPTQNLADLEIPPLLENGLELPVDGATGFASVLLPVWPACPGDRAGYKLASFETGNDGSNASPSSGTASLSTSSEASTQGNCLDSSQVSARL